MCTWWKVQAGLILAEPERRFGADDVDRVAARSQRLAELRGHDAAATDRGVADDADVHARSLPSGSRCGRSERLADDEAFREGDAGLGTEVRVAALDQLMEPHRGEPRVDRVGGSGANWLTWQASARRLIS